MHLLDPIKASIKLQPKLVKLNLHTYWDLALHLPLRYEDQTQVYPIAQLKAGQQQLIQGKIIGHELIQKKAKQLLVRVDDGSAIITMLFFHFFPNYATQYATGKEIRAHGEVKLDRYGNPILVHPKIQAVTPQSKLSNTFSPVYPSTAGLSNEEIALLVENFFELANIPETIPPSIREQYRLPELAKALLTLHKLTPSQCANRAQDAALRRLKFDELIAQQLLMQKIYTRKHHKAAPRLPSSAQPLAHLIQALPFELTRAQQRVLGEILADLAQATQMNRLLQGDVGSGKTIIATLAALVTIANGYQAVIMAPTEILAEQHYLKTRQLLADSGITVCWLAGSLSPKNKKAAAAACADGSAQLIIGTHAVFQKQVNFQRLGLVVIDEQHRFGVDQRLALINKGNAGVEPHQLMMSATPIPRSLAMSYYADLDVSSIDELPPGRTPIKTLLINNQRRPEVINFLQQSCTAGQQAYWVCPLIEESEKLALENALRVCTELTEELAPLSVGLVHGKLKASEKAAVMSAFNSGELQILVATTVIEVGVDVPNATIMVIEHSERMGLAQLHQLRGRVGRGNLASQCVLLYEAPLSELAKQRLKVISSSNDGFEIARQDLLIRGPGELLGNRQSGLPALRFANLEQDLEILFAAREIAQTLAQDYPLEAKFLVELWFYHQQIYAGS